MKLEPTDKSRDAKSVFLEAIEKPVAQRREFVTTKCSGNRELETKVLELISFFEKDSDSILDTQEIRNAIRRDLKVAPVTSDVLTHRSSNQRIVGRYMLLSIARQDSWGKVFRAVQMNPVRRYVFVKILANGNQLPAIERIKSAKCTAATLEHPNIASIFDAGIHPQYGGFLVMETVDGDSIVKHCDARNLSIEDRLALFVKVCNAIKFMHDNHCIFRDLSPGNILVDNRGEPKIIEFGVAISIKGEKKELVHVSESREEYELPVYKSPEQLQLPDSRIDQTSDVFSLGVLLHELLCGHPHITDKQLASLEYAEKIRFLCGVDPEPASVQLSSKRLQQLSNYSDLSPRKTRIAISSGLDSIISKCLMKTPADRYQNIEMITNSIQKFLEKDLPALKRNSLVSRVKNALGSITRKGQ